MKTQLSKICGVQHSENYKTLMKEIKDNTNRKIYHAHELEEYLKNVDTT